MRDKVGGSHIRAMCEFRVDSVFGIWAGDGEDVGHVWASLYRYSIPDTILKITDSRLSDAPPFDLPEPD